MTSVSRSRAIPLPRKGSRGKAKRLTLQAMYYNIKRLCLRYKVILSTCRRWVWQIKGSLFLLSVDQSMSLVCNCNFAVAQRNYSGKNNQKNRNVNCQEHINHVCSVCRMVIAQTNYYGGGSISTYRNLADWKSVMP